MPELKIRLEPIKQEIEDAVNARQPGLTGQAFNIACAAEADNKLNNPHNAFIGIQREMALMDLIQQYKREIALTA